MTNVARSGGGAMNDQRGQEWGGGAMSDQRGLGVGGAMSDQRGQEWGGGYE